MGKKKLITSLGLFVAAVAVTAVITQALDAQAIDTTSCTTLVPYYLDGDDDGYGLATTGPLMACSLPDGYSANDDDCNDAVGAVNPGAAEICDAYDNDCDGAVNEGLATSTRYRDADGDGYGDAATTTSWCGAVAGYVANDDDCDDTRSQVHPGAIEQNDDRDNDCDGNIDEGLNTWYRDADSDGYGNASVSTSTVSAPAGFVANDDDCNDANAAVKPGAAEVDDDIDNDCDGSIDEGFVAVTWYRDADGDGYGKANDTVSAVTQPSGYVGNDDDCNDNSSAIKPGATEVDDDVDNDCDGSIDEGFVSSTWYRDADSDGYGNAAITQSATSQPSGYVSNDDDCNDNNSAIKPGATEVDDDVDNDCDGSVDEGFSTTWWFHDLDGDGYGNPNCKQQSATQPSGYVSNDDDCNDTNAAAHPGATEADDGIDNDCDGTVDEGFDGNDDDDDDNGCDCDCECACSCTDGHSCQANRCNRITDRLGKLADRFAKQKQKLEDRFHRQEQKLKDKQQQHGCND